MRSNATDAAKKLVDLILKQLPPSAEIQTLARELRDALDAEDHNAIYVTVTDRDSDRPDPRSYGPIVMETPVRGSTLEAAKARAVQMCERYGETHIARLEFVGPPFVRPQRNTQPKTEPTPPPAVPEPMAAPPFPECSHDYQLTEVDEVVARRCTKCGEWEPPF